MNFCEAMEKLKSGSKITREPWKDGVYFLMDKKDVKSFQPRVSHYIYNEDIMISDGWMVEGDEKEYSFSQIISFLKNGSKAKMNDWKEAYIYLDPSENALVLHSMDIFPFVPQFNDFSANDWMEIE